MNYHFKAYYMDYIAHLFKIALQLCAKWAYDDDFLWFKNETIFIFLFTNINSSDPSSRDGRYWIYQVIVDNADNF